MNRHKTFTHATNEIDLKEMFTAVWQGKWIIIVVTTLFTLASIFYTLSLPNIYKSEVLLAPVAKDSRVNIPGQLGGLAALAGVELGSAGGSETNIALEILKSREFISRFIKKNDLLIPIMAAEGWNRESDTLTIDSDIYNLNDNTWVRDVSPPFDPKPSGQEAYIEFMELLSVIENKDTGFIKVSVQYYSPILAMQWVSDLVTDINEEMRNRMISEANLSLKYLNKEIKRTTLSEARSMMFTLIEEQTKNLMLANIREQYVFKVVDPPFYPELKHSPNRAMIVIFAAVAGFFISSIFITLSKFNINMRV